MKKLVIFGDGATASTLHYHLARESELEVAAFTVDRRFIREPALHGLPVVPWDEIVSSHPPSEYAMMIAIGPVQMNQLRAARYDQARQMGYRLASHRSPRAILWDGLNAGENCILDNIEIQPFSHIGSNVVIGSGSIIGHYCMINDHCFISGGVLIAGNVTVGSHCYIGIGATIRDNVVIAPSCIIGAGAVILNNTEENGIYMSKPAYRIPHTNDKLFAE